MRDEGQVGRLRPGILVIAGSGSDEAAGEGIAMSDKSDSFAATGGAQVAF